MTASTTLKIAAFAPTPSAMVDRDAVNQAVSECSKASLSSEMTTLRQLICYVSLYAKWPKWPYLGTVIEHFCHATRFCERAIYA
jgi:hypothetical protein